MSTLYKGTLATVVATVVASGIILLSESSIAETKPQVSVSTDRELIKSDTGTAIQQSPSKKNKLIDLSKKDVMLAPPPGPFLNEGLLESLQQKKSPVAPKTPMQAAHKIQMPTSPVNSLSLKAAPKLTKKILVVPSEGQAPSLNKSMPSSPQYNGQIPVMSPPSLPIWSQKGQQGANFGSNNSRAAPINNGAMMNNNNFGWGYPVQQYMYIPVPMMPSNIVAPQMPIFNRAPAPMPNYWIPTPAAKQKNVPKKDNN